MTREEKETLDRDGVVLLKGLFAPERIAELLKEYLEHDALAVQRDAPKGEPIVVYWTHQVGNRKRITLLGEMPCLLEFACDVAQIVKKLVPGEALRLLETIIFNKPPKDSNVLRWHQDVSYFPFEPNNQLAVWVPFDVVTRDSGAVVYALGTHRMGLKASTDLHSGTVFTGEHRAPIPANPEESGIETRCMEMKPGDMLIHDGRTWHMSGPNTTSDRQRRGLSLRFLVGTTRYKPRPGSAAAFMKQVDLQPGDVVDDPAFPVLA